MKQIDDLPLEIHEKILSYLMTDPFTLHRIELVCQLWASIIRFFENKRGLNFRKIKVFDSNEIIIPFINNLSPDQAKYIVYEQLHTYIWVHFYGNSYQNSNHRNPTRAQLTHFLY